MKEDFKNIFEYIFEKEITNICPIDEGIENSAIIKTQDNKYVLKYHENDYYDSPDGFLAGPKLVNIISQNSQIPVPNIINYGKTNNHTYYLSEYVDGFHYDVENNSYNLQKKIISNLGQYLAELHNLDCQLNKYGWVGYNQSEDKLYLFKNYDRFDILLGNLLNNFNESIKNGGKYNNRDTKDCRFADCCTDITKIINHVEDNIIIDTIPTYCHGDYKYDNIIIQNTSNPVQAIIDWDMPLISDPLFNIIKSEWKLIMHYNIHTEISKTKQKNLLKIYRRAYLRKYQNDIDFNLDHIYVYNFYIMLTCMNNFGHWYEDYSESKKQKTEEYLRNKIEITKNYFN